MKTNLLYLLFFLIIPFRTYAVKSNNSGKKYCLRLEKDKVNGVLRDVIFYNDKELGKKSSLKLTVIGLIDGEKKICEWSLNNGSGTKKEFSLDHGIVIPVLVKNCENPFSSVQTGLGFGDWVFMLCGEEVGRELIGAEWKGKRVFVSKKSMLQWTFFDPAKINMNWGD